MVNSSSPLPKQFSQVVFCDFDGTITGVETFAGMLKEFAPELSAATLPQIYTKQITLREGIKKILASIPTSVYPEIIDYVAHKPVRPGLKELIDFLEQKSIPFVVVSGGLQDMVEKVLSRENLLARVSNIFAAQVELNQETIQVFSEFEEGTELVAKAKIMAQYPAAETVVIGDSITDLSMARQADLVFARSLLQKYLEEENKPYIAWNDFWEIRAALMNRWLI